jgi:hypothetical protein
VAAVLQAFGAWTAPPPTHTRVDDTITAATPTIEMRATCKACGTVYVESYRRGSARLNGDSCPVCGPRRKPDHDEPDT